MNALTRQRAKVYLVCTVFFSQVSAAGGPPAVPSRAPGGSALVRAERAYFEESALRGFTGPEALRLARIYNPAAADQAYLGRVEGRVAAVTERVKMRAIERTNSGYKYTFPNGRVVAVTTARDGHLSVDGKDCRAANLEGKIECLQRAIDTRYGAGDWSFLPRAHAQSAVLGVAYIAAMIGVGVLLHFGLFSDRISLKEKSQELTRLTERQAKTCAQEAKDQKIAYDQSQTKMMIDNLVKTGIFRETADGPTLNCRNIPDFNKETNLPTKVEEQAGLQCLNLQSLQYCATALRARGTAASAPPAVAPSPASR